jgi:hypothetical protein
VRAAAALFVLLLLPTEAVAGSTAREVAEALRDDPVYVAPASADLLTVAQRGRLRLRIVDRDVGRIQIAVVPGASAQRAGGLNEYANAVDQAMPGRRGALLVTTGTAFHVITSHAVINPTLAAVRAAVESKREKGLQAQLLAAVDGIAEVDPGASADPAGLPSPGGASDGPGAGDPSASGDEFLDDVGDSVRLGVLIAAAAVALPFVLGALGLTLMWRRRRAAAEQREQITSRDTRDELVAFGEEIRALDLDVEMPGVSPTAREEYERALNLYDRANRLLAGDDPSEVQLYEARRSVEEGRARLRAAESALAGSAKPVSPDAGA